MCYIRSTEVLAQFPNQSVEKTPLTAWPASGHRNARLGTDRPASGLTLKTDRPASGRRNARLGTDQPAEYRKDTFERGSSRALAVHFAS